ncbi:MAG: DUF3048 domain-containing protein, partial [Anaerolineaceae bacterium]|nr:DUF3048 domain-containing protein [Anaerolineaceae bacterium]
MHIKRALIFVCAPLLTLSLMLSACAGKTAESGRANTPFAPGGTPAPTDAKAEDTAAPTVQETVFTFNPLTGLPVSDPALLERRPVMVKVSNFPRLGRPHAGLSFADIVFEYFIGFGQNRFLALYYGQDAEKIGPVRSGRRVDAELVTMYSGVLG